MIYITEDVKKIWKSELVMETERGKWRPVITSFTDTLYELDYEWITVEQLPFLLEERFFLYILFFFALGDVILLFVQFDLRCRR
jgi:hypothetical protein